MQKLLEVNAVTRQFRNCEALRGVDMTICEGKIVGLLGPNASGKTTLLNCYIYRVCGCQLQRF